MICDNWHMPLGRLTSKRELTVCLTESEGDKRHPDLEF